MADAVDLLVIGGGINGAGIARDAAGRGLSVVLCEKGDLARSDLVALDQADPWRPALSRILRFPPGARGADGARSVVGARAAHHLAAALRAAALTAGLRPAWMLRLGLFLYDHHRRPHAPAGRRARFDLRREPAGAPLLPDYVKGFEYSDCWADDARLVVLNALDAARARRDAS